MMIASTFLDATDATGNDLDALLMDPDDESNPLSDCGVSDCGVFTVQEEVAEIKSSTASELISAESDLRGTASNLSQLEIQDALDVKGLREELARLPREQTAAYFTAVRKCPSQVNEERLSAFLEREDNRAHPAAVRLALYWQFRLELFGPDRCFLDMTLKGAMQDEVKHLVENRVVHLLPVTDTAGRAIVFVDPSRRNFAKYSAEQEVMAMWYFGEVIMENEEAQKRGFVYMVNLQHMEQQHFSQKFLSLKKKLELCTPIRPRAIHSVYPNFFANFFVYPLIKFAFGGKYRRRFIPHYGTTPQVLKDLEGYCLPRNRLPADIGGDITLDMAKWVSDRLALESSRVADDPRLVVSIQEEDNLVLDVPTAKRVRRDDTAAVFPHSSTTFKGRGIPDERMDRAVYLRLANPESSLKDVLLRAGFTFDNKNEKGKEVDADNITLAQRKNNLCRRVRLEKKKRARKHG